MPSEIRFRGTRSDELKFNPKETLGYASASDRSEVCRLEK